MIPATHGGLRYGSCPHCAQQPEHCLDPSSCALCRCDFCEGRRLLGGGAAGFAGGADILLGHLERGSKRDDGGAVGLRLAVDQVGDRVGAQSSRLAPCAETALLNHGPEQFAQGLDGGSLCHAGTLSGIGERKLETALDKTVGSDESAQVKNAPDAANLGGASAPGAEPRT